jgi:hypothetical protein
MYTISNIKFSSLLVASLVSPIMAAPTNDKQAETQKVLNDAEAKNIGLSFNGVAKSKVESADLGAGSLGSGADRKTQAFIQSDITIEGRPSQNLRAKVEFRLHQDWSNYYDEGPRPFINRWFSLDGNVLDGHFQLHVGDYFYKNTPLTGWAYDHADFLYEPEIFAQKKAQAKTEQRLQGNERALQGFSFRGTTAEFLGDFELAASIDWARLRRPWWSTGVFQYDTYPTEKFFYDLGLEIKAIRGLSLKANYLRTFDNEESSLSYNRQNLKGKNLDGFFVVSSQAKLLLEGGEPDGKALLVYEDNSIFNTNLVFDMQAINPSSNLILKADAEWALSSYQVSYDTLYADTLIDDSFGSSESRDWLGVIETIENETITAQAIRASLDFGVQNKSNGFLINGTFFDVEKDYVADLAQSRTYNKNSIYSGEGAFTGIFESMYLNTFQVKPSTEVTHFEDNTPLEDPAYNGTNNYFRAGYEATGYNPIVSTQLERDAQPASINPENLFQSHGYATSNRSGGDGQLNLDFANRTFNIIGVGGYAKEKDFVARDKKAVFMKYGGGMKLRLSGAALLSNDLNFYGSFVQQKRTQDKGKAFGTATDKSLDVSNIINAGSEIGLGKDLTLQLGYQQISYNHKTNDIIKTSLDEYNLGGSLSYKIDHGSYLKLGYNHIYGEQSLLMPDGSEERSVLELKIPSAEYTILF